jgi:hypothetical protein
MADNKLFYGDNLDVLRRYVGGPSGDDVNDQIDLIPNRYGFESSTRNSQLR